MAIPRPAFDPELALLLQAPQFARDDNKVLTKEVIIEMRKDIEIHQQATIQEMHDDPDLSHEEVTIPGPGGDIVLLIVRSKSSTKSKDAPALYLIHGGGMIIGNRFFLTNAMFPFMREIGAVLISVEYRLAPEHPAPAAVGDCYAGLDWVFENAGKLGIDASKIVTTGGSAGGCLAAGVTLLDRDRKGPRLLAQMLMYPMLDDRADSVSVKQFFHDGTWTGKANTEAWGHYLPGIRGTDQVRIYEAPARAQDLSNLPPTFIEVGACDSLRDEDVAYAMRLWEHGNQTELHVWPGGLHAFDVFLPSSQLAKVSIDTRMKWLKRIVNTPSA